MIGNYLALGNYSRSLLYSLGTVCNVHFSPLLFFRWLHVILSLLKNAQYILIAQSDIPEEYSWSSSFLPFYLAVTAVTVWNVAFLTIFLVKWNHTVQVFKKLAFCLL